THAFVQSASEPDIMCALPHIASLTFPVKLCALSAANTVTQTTSAARKIPNFCEPDFMCLSPENLESAPQAHFSNLRSTYTEYQRQPKVTVRTTFFQASYSVNRRHGL